MKKSEVQTVINQVGTLIDCIPKSKLRNFVYEMNEVYLFLEALKRASEEG